jgi:hypothetical protein
MSRMGSGKAGSFWFTVRGAGDSFPVPISLAAACDCERAKPRLLVIRGYDDEAALTLAAGAIGARTAALLNLAIQSRILPGVWVIFGFALLISLAGSEFLNFEFHLLLRLYGLLMGIVFLACFFLILAPNLFRTVYGREFLIGATRCDVVADSVPDGVNATVVTLPPPVPPPDRSRRMRHSIHAHPACFDAIAKWLADEVAWRSNERAE